MISELLFQKIVDTIVRYKKPIIIIGSVSIVLFILFKLFTSYAIVDITVTSPGLQNSSADISLYGSEPSGQKDLGSSGIKIVSRSTKSIIASSGDHIRTESVLEIPWFGYTQKSIPLELDKNADKVAYENSFAQPCSTYNSQLDSLLSYDCKYPVSLSQTKQDNTTAVTQFRFVNPTASPYMGGVAGFNQATAEHVDGAVSVVFGDGKTTSYATPKEVDRTTLTDAKFFGNAHDPTDTRFVMVDKSGNVYLGSPNTDTGAITYVKYPAPKEYVANAQQTICGFGSSDAVYCYRGKYAVGDAPQVDTPLLETVTKLSFLGSKASVFELKTDGSFMDNFYVTKNNEIYTSSFKKLTHYTVKNKTYSPTVIAQNVDGAAVSDSMYYTQENGVFKYDDKKQESRQLFYSPNIRATRLYASGNKVFVIGGISDTSPKYAYLLNGTSNVTPGKRIIDILPTSDANLPMTSSNDLIGNRLFVTVKVLIDKNARSAASAVNQSDLDETKDDVRNAVANLGIDLNSLEIQYNY